MDTPATPLTLPDAPATERRDFFRALGAALVAGALMFIAVVGFITLLNTSSTLNETSATLTEVRHGQIQTKRIADNLAKAYGVVGKAAARIEGNEAAICTALHITCPTAP